MHPSVPASSKPVWRDASPRNRNTNPKLSSSYNSQGTTWLNATKQAHKIWRYMLQAWHRQINIETGRSTLKTGRSTGRSKKLCCTVSGGYPSRGELGERGGRGCVNHPAVSAILPSWLLVGVPPLRPTPEQLVGWLVDS